MKDCKGTPVKLGDVVWISTPSINGVKATIESYVKAREILWVKPIQKSVLILSNDGNVAVWPSEITKCEVEELI